MSSPTINKKSLTKVVKLLQTSERVQQDPALRFRKETRGG